ncbi:MAG: uL14 family ribosomal protein [DPANN group archaeon]|nr:uL14 family ribosomal protein [DPANN group archaeon]
MKGISTKTVKGLKVGSALKCIDNTGAKMLEIISVRGYRGVRGRQPKAGVGDVVVCAVKKGNQKIAHEVVKAVIVTQRAEYRRSNGIRIKFAENTAILLQDTLEPRGKEIKGIVAKEVVERFPAVGKIARIII